MNVQLSEISLPFDKLDLDDFFPNSSPLIHFPGDFPITLTPITQNHITQI